MTLNLVKPTRQISVLSRVNCPLLGKLLEAYPPLYYCRILSQVLDEDPWLGSIRRFPPVLHARASLVYDVTIETLQKTLVRCLMQLQMSTRTIELSLSDQPGYLDGTVGFRVGVGNDDGFDI